MDRQSKEARRHWLTIKLAPYLGVATISKIIEHYPLGELLGMNAQQLSGLGLKLRPQTIEALANPDNKRLDDLERWAEAPNNHIVDFDSTDYPTPLRQIASAPEVIFVRGDKAVLKSPQLAMIGSRDLTVAGKENAYRFAFSAAELGITVTSGLAIGVDGQSHRGALAANGKTIAVLGTGVDQIYPRRHLALAEQICRNGALVSEFLPNQGVKAEHFPRRNRIISGLSQGTLVVEAALKSGSLITARYALEQNREVFAIPGSIHNPMSTGCHQLIKQGAKLVESMNDVIEEVVEFQQLIGKAAIENRRANPNMIEDADPLLTHIGYEVTPADCIAQRSGLAVSLVLSKLLDLEMAGHIAAVAGGYVRV